ncbi:glycosyltransferase family 4 protein [Carboxylicivirga marina]|uniref:Glycosyltransferase family 4 protein n=1 Tax=Carboxylicivirga marina TaxID=2800988 RepID=A0ABS1HKL7_9BACT|nr:glycosyltransferase family 4 protein [Carboxylicivirga marina]MBK3518010.1 glycosyltransferase family 4 protein [Carboxylicivirga marina]
MKVLIVNLSDIEGGAARAAYRLHQSLLGEGVDSQMLVINKRTTDYTVLSSNTKSSKLLDAVRPSIEQLPVKFYKNKSKTTFSNSCIGKRNLFKIINEINPDIVHLHWICGGMIRIEDFKKIKAPIVWSLHDMWAFTGGCHYNEDCNRYQVGCGECKVLHSRHASDLSSRVWKRKNRTYNRVNSLTIVGLSSWLNDCSKNSFLLKGKKHYNLPNPINTNLYRPFDKSQARDLWRLPKDKKLVLFGAMGATSDPRKGYVLLKEALAEIKHNDVELIVFGSSKPKDSQNLGFKTHYLGHIHDDVSLVTLYSCVDVMVVPSVQENLSNAIMESLACGTPVVGFNIGGNSDMIEHKLNGYLAPAFDITELSRGIDWVINNNSKNEISEYARTKVVTCFDSEKVGKRYLSLYKEILRN